MKVADNLTLEPTNEEKRLRQFEDIAKNWDRLPEKAQGRLEGEISMAHILLCGQQRFSEEEKVKEVV